MSHKNGQTLLHNAKARSVEGTLTRMAFQISLIDPTFKPSWSPSCCSSVSCMSRRAALVISRFSSASHVAEGLASPRVSSQSYSSLDRRWGASVGLGTTRDGAAAPEPTLTAAAGRPAAQQSRRSFEPLHMSDQRHAGAIEYQHRQTRLSQCKVSGPKRNLPVPVAVLAAGLAVDCCAATATAPPTRG